MSLSLLLVSVLGLVAARLDSCPATPPTGRAPVWFDFQVDRPVRLVGSDTTLPRPDASLRESALPAGEFALAQFVVDTAGVPEGRSLKLLKHPQGLSVEAVSSALQRWRFEPAIARSCKVPQLVMIPLRWK